MTQKNKLKEKYPAGKYGNIQLISNVIKGRLTALPNLSSFLFYLTP